MYSKSLFESIKLIENIFIVGAQMTENDSKQINNIYLCLSVVYYRSLLKWFK